MNWDMHLPFAVMVVILSSVAMGAAAQGSRPPATVQVSQAPSLRSYSHDNPAFSLRYPDGFLVNETYSYTRAGAGKDIPGVAFVIPSTMVAGTNLGSDSYFSVEWRGDASCNTQAFLPGSEKPITIGYRGLTYQVAKLSTGGGGNMYEETIYLRDCLVVRYFIHSSNAANYPPGTIREFDRATLISIFDAIRHSLS
jgi:hypothetical protein